MDIQPVIDAPGKGRIFYQGGVYNATWNRSSQISYRLVFEIDDNGFYDRFTITDKDERLGILYAADDSNYTLHNCLVILGDDEPDPTNIPTKDDLKINLMTSMLPIVRSFSEGNTCAEDMQFCREIFSTPEAMLRTIQKKGSLEDAQKHILEEIFLIRL